MTVDNKKNQPVLLLILTIVLLFLFSLIPENIDLGVIKTKKIDFLIDVKSDNDISAYSIAQKKQLSGLASVLSSLNLFFNSFIYQPGVESLSGSTTQMNYFYNALKKGDAEKIRIAHFGDSAIEGDMVTSELRLNFQKEFNGYGVGFLAITSKDIRFRASIRHTFSDNWKTYSVTESSSLPFLPGMNGYVSVPKSGSWVKYEVSGIGNSPEYFRTVRIFYTNAKKSTVTYKFDNGKENKAELEPGKNIKELVLTADGKTKSVVIRAGVDNQAQFFGVSLESGKGIYIDNFPLRGNSGLSLENIPTDILSGFNRLMNYKLIVLNFGLNLVSEMSDFTRYEKQMVKVINKLKQAFPETSFLLISVGDKSMKKGSRFVTDPNIPKLVEAQKRIAENSGCAFWNLYEAMGGENSMQDWVNASPPLASKDYTHVNLDGGKKIADMLTEAILNNYRQNK